MHPPGAPLVILLPHPAKPSGWLVCATSAGQSVLPPLATLCFRLCLLRLRLPPLLACSFILLLRPVAAAAALSCHVAAVLSLGPPLLPLLLLLPPPLRPRLARLPPFPSALHLLRGRLCPPLCPLSCDSRERLPAPGILYIRPTCGSHPPSFFHFTLSTSFYLPFYLPCRASPLPPSLTVPWPLLLSSLPLFPPRPASSSPAPPPPTHWHHAQDDADRPPLRRPPPGSEYGRRH